MYEYSGTCKLPIRINGIGFGSPFYWVVEKEQNEEMIHIRLLEGEPYRLGDVYGFFGFSTFQKYKRNIPIIIVEGISDWAVVKEFYPYVLAILTSTVSTKQLFFLSSLTNIVIKALDNDDAGVSGSITSGKKFDKVGVLHIDFNCPAKDWGKAWEDTYLREELPDMFKVLLQMKLF